MNYDAAKEFIESCTDIEQLRNWFISWKIQSEFDKYTEKYFPNGGRKRKPEQQGTSDEVHRSIKSKQDVDNLQNYTEEMFAEYKIKFDRGDNKGYLENVVVTIEIAFAQYIIALRKLLGFNTGGHLYPKEFKCSLEEVKSFMLVSIRFKEEVYNLRNNIGMMD